MSWRQVQTFTLHRALPAGNEIAWIEWHHPNMPWDETELVLASLDDAGQVSEPIRVTDAGEAAFQPEFGPMAVSSTCRTAADGGTYIG